MTTNERATKVISHYLIFWSYICLIWTCQSFSNLVLLHKYCHVLVKLDEFWKHVVVVVGAAGDLLLEFSLQQNATTGPQREVGIVLNNHHHQLPCNTLPHQPPFFCSNSSNFLVTWNHYVLTVQLRDTFASSSYI